MSDIDEYIEKKFIPAERRLVKTIYEDLISPFMGDVMKLKYEVQTLKQQFPSIIKEVTSLETKGNIIVDFYGEWCIPCYEFLPAIEKVANEYKDENIKFIKIDIDKNPEITNELKISSIPLLALYKDGILIYKIEGCPNEKRADYVRWMVQRALIPEDEWQETFNIMSKVAKAKGWHFNPDQWIRDALIAALTWNKRKYGSYYCPCKPQHISQNKCPCKPYNNYFGSAKAVRLNDICYCGLFVSDKYLANLQATEESQSEE